MWSGVADVRYTYLADDRARRGGDQPGARGAARRHLRLLRGGRHRHPAGDRDPALGANDSTVDGASGGDAEDLVGAAGLLHDHDHHLAHRLDGAGAGRPRSVSSLREEDFVTAADLVGARQSRIIFVHMVPLFQPHHRRDDPGAAGDDHQRDGAELPRVRVAAAGDLLWGIAATGAERADGGALMGLLLPAVPVILVILAFNFLGDGLRDAADPYHVNGVSGWTKVTGERGTGGGKNASPSPRHPVPLSPSARHLLAVRDLKTYFYQDDGLVKAVDGASFDVFPGKTLGIVGEVGAAKSVTARSILRIVDRPGRIVGGQILLRREGECQRHGRPRPTQAGWTRDAAIAGGEIGLIFQEPMTSFSPAHGRRANDRGDPAARPTEP